MEPWHDPHPGSEHEGRVRAILEAAVQLPVAQRRNGVGLGQDFVGRVGIRLNL